MASPTSTRGQRCIELPAGTKLSTGVVRWPKLTRTKRKTGEKEKGRILVVGILPVRGGEPHAGGIPHLDVHVEAWHVAAVYP